KTGNRPFGYAQGRLFGGGCFILDSRFRGNDKYFAGMTSESHAWLKCYNFSEIYWFCEKNFI
ncbi:MAG: hypothetical protein DRP66_08925, partial [Planctomycetota bacterium]